MAHQRHDGQQVGDTVATTYYSIPGGVAFREDVDPLVFPPPFGWSEITLGAYNAQVALLAANEAAAQAAAKLADCMARKHAYDVLTASVHTADWDDATIRLITGFYGGC